MQRSVCSLLAFALMGGSAFAQTSAGALVGLVLLFTVKSGKAPTVGLLGLLAALHSTLPYSVYILYLIQFDQH